MSCMALYRPDQPCTLHVLMYTLSICKHRVLAACTTGLDYIVWIMNVSIVRVDLINTPGKSGFTDIR